MMDYLSIGYILKPQGIKGELKVMPLTDDIQRFSRLKWVFFKNNDQYEKTYLKKVRIQGDTVFITLEGIDDRNKAEAYRGQYIWIDRDHAIRLPKDTYFICDLIGCTIVDLEGKKMGIIEDILQTGSNDVYVVKDGNHEILIPAIKSVIKEVSIRKKEIIVDSAMLEEVVVHED